MVRGVEESELERTGHMVHRLREVQSPNWNFRIFQKHPVHCSLETGCTLAAADWWWESTLREAKCYYDRWRNRTPLQRIQICPRLPEDLSERKFQRTEQRGVQMLLKAIPAAEQQELVTDRALSSTAILYKLMVRFQPGGAGEKQILLKQLTSMPKMSTIQEVAAAIRSWRRHFGRAEEVQAVLPDGILLLQALDDPLQKIAAMDQQAAFRF